MSSSRRSAATRTAITAALSLIVAACWSSTPTVSPAGSVGPSATPGGTPAVVVPTASPTATPPPASEPVPSPTIVPSASATPSPVDPLAAAGALASLGSYHVSMSGLTGQGRFTAEVTVVQRPTPSRAATITVGGSTIRAVTIGDKAWIDRTGKGKLVPGAFGLVDGTLGAVEPATLVSIFGGADYVIVGPETKNGALTTHYHADATSGPGPGGATFPPGASIDLWVSIDGHLVAFEANDFPGEGGPADLRIEVTRANDPANRVTAPA